MCMVNALGPPTLNIQRFKFSANCFLDLALITNVNCIQSARVFPW